MRFQKIMRPSKLVPLLFVAVLFSSTSADELVVNSVSKSDRYQIISPEIEVAQAISRRRFWNDAASSMRSV